MHLLNYIIHSISYFTFLSPSFIRPRTHIYKLMHSSFAFSFIRSSSRVPFITVKVLTFETSKTELTASKIPITTGSTRDSTLITWDK